MFRKKELLTSTVVYEMCANNNHTTGNHYEFSCPQTGATSVDSI